MKLYAWIPKGSIGQYSIVVIAESEAAAKIAADAEVESLRQTDPRNAPHQLRGWGTDHYELETREANSALTIMV